MALNETRDPFTLFERKKDVNAEPVEQVLGEFGRVDWNQGIEPAACERMRQLKGVTELTPIPAL